MAAVDFSEYFWGEKNEGFNVLYQNMKAGLNAARELADYLREAARVQEDTAKAHVKLVKQLSATSQCGTFAPTMAAFKTKTEKLAAVHNHWMLRLSDLVKDVVKYTEDLHRLHKKVKEDESTTLEAVKSIQETTALLQKSKEAYKQRCLEVERQKRDGVTGNKDLDKSEVKFRKAQEEYRSLVDKYCQCRDDFERKMTLSSKRFQEVEETHLKQMRLFVESYCQIVDNNNNQWGRIHQEFQIQLAELTLENLLEQFTLSKHTGLEKPGRWERFKYESSLQHSPLKKTPSVPSPPSYATAPRSKARRRGPIEFEEEISVSSVTGPPSDVSDKSGNSDKVSLGSAAGLATTQQQSQQQPTTVAAAAAAAAAAPITRKESSDVGSDDIEKPDELKGVCMVERLSDGGGTTATNRRAESAQSLQAGGECTIAVDGLAPPPDLLVGDRASGADGGGDGAESAVAQNTEQPQQALQEEHSPSRSPRSISGWTGFLGRRLRKKKKDEDVDSAKGSEGEDASSRKTQDDVDEDGYSRQPPTAATGSSSDPWADFNVPAKSFYSSSDESDDEAKRKIKVEIKPVSNGGGAPISASVDELQKAVGGLELLPQPVSRLRPRSALNDRIGSGTQTLRIQKPREPGQLDVDGLSLRRSQSQSHVNSSKPSQDLLGLSLHPIESIDDNSTVNEDSVNKSQVMDTSTASSATTTNKEIREIFGDDASPVQQPSLPPKSNRPSSVQRERVSNSLIALPRPPSRHGSAISTTSSSSQQQRVRSSHSLLPATLLGDVRLSVAKQQESSRDNGGDQQRSSSSSPPETSTRPSFGTSRGPSPLTLGMADVVPLAVAFQEVCHACFRGVDERGCQTRLIGDMMVSFPAGIVQVLASNPNAAPLMFRIKNASALESVLPNRHLISPLPTMSTNDTSVFEFHMNALKELLRKQAEQNPKASYFNIDILKYQIKSKPGAGSCPLQMVAYWKCADDHTDLRLDYKYNVHAMAAPHPILNLSIAVPVDGGVKNMQSKPNGTWLSESNRALWKFSELSPNGPDGVGSLRGRFELSDGPGSQGTIAAQFNCEGTTLSGVDFELVGSGYRLSLVKKRFVSGKYVCDGDATLDNRYRYAAPPSNAETTC